MEFFPNDEESLVPERYIGCRCSRDGFPQKVQRTNKRSFRQSLCYCFYSSNFLNKVMSEVRSFCFDHRVVLGLFCFRLNVAS